MPHGRHIYAKAYDMAKATMCSYPQSKHALPHWKCVLRCCAKCTSVNLPDQEKYAQYPDTSPSICFQIYHIIVSCTTHGRIPLTDKKICCKCRQDTASEQSTQIYTTEELLMTETTIYNFHKSFYIPAIYKLAFNIPHVQILGKNHCGDSLQTAFKLSESFQDVLCCLDYAKMLVASFAYQI